MAIGTSADIGIRVFLDDAASQGLNAISASLATMAGFGAAFGIFAGILTTAIKDASDFQTILIQMGRAGNLTQEQMAGLGQTLMDVGGHSIFSIEELGQAFVVLLQRGVSAADIMHGVGQQAVYLAEATGMQAVPAAQLLASTLVSFNIPASQAAKTVDLLQFLIEHGIGPSDALGESLARLGAISSILHISLDQIVPAFDVLSRATGSYSTAATALYYFLNQVKFGTATYRDEIQKLGLSFYDAHGNFIGLNKSLGELYQTLQNKSPKEAAAILGALFNIRSSQGIGILLQDLKQVYGLTEKLAKSHDNLGTAMQRAKQAEDSASGAWQGVRTNFQDVLTLMGGPFLSVIQPLLIHVRDATAALRVWAQDNPKLGATFIGVGTALAALGLIIAVALSPIGAFVGIVLAVIAGVALLAAGITFLVAKWQVVIAWLHPVIVMFQALFKALDFGSAIKALGDAWHELWTAIQPLLPVLKWILIALGLLVGGLILGVVVVLVVLARVVIDVVAAAFHLLAMIISTVIGVIQTAIQLAPQFIGELVNGFHGVVSFFQSLPGRIIAALGSTSSMLFNSGQNIIQGLINGIGSMIGNLFSAIGSAVNAIRSHLPFSPVKVGPLVGIENSGLTLMKMVADGIDKGAPLVHAAMNRATGGMAWNPQMYASMSGSSQGYRSGVGGAYLQPINLVVDGKVLTQVVMNNLTGQLQMNGGGRAFR